MYQKATSIYYSLAIFVAGTAAFVMYPSNTIELANWQSGVKNDFKIAVVQTLGDQPWFTEVGQVYEAVADFYEQSSSATIALISQPEADEDMIYVFSEVYKTFAKSFQPNHSDNNVAYDNVSLPLPGENFMTEEPLYNIVPYRTVVTTIDTGEVAGASINNTHPVNIDTPWVTIKDNLTGQLYCLAIYNGSVNQYLGACKNDYQ